MWQAWRRRDVSGVLVSKPEERRQVERPARATVIVTGRTELVCWTWADFIWPRIGTGVGIGELRLS